MDIPADNTVETDSGDAVAVNANYLDKVMALSKEMDVAATEDIFDARGVKLVAKGTKISPALQERLILHKLKKPLEACLAVDGGVTPEGLATEARRVVEGCIPLLQLMTMTGGKGATAFDVLAKLRLGNAMGLMLTMTERGGTNALKHALTVSLIAFCLAKKSGYETDRLSNILLAGLLHDIGELYIDPQYLTPGRRLLPHEWRHIVVHPKISGMLIADLGGFHKEVSLAASQHHERLNATGYPQRLGGKSLERSGQILSVAETVSGIFLDQERPLECAELALKIIPGEYDPGLVSIISGAIRNRDEEIDELHQPEYTPAALQRARALTQRLSDLACAGKTLCEGAQAQAHGNLARGLLKEAMERISLIERAFIGTGLGGDMLDDASLGSDLRFVFEAAVVSREIQWRLRDVARDLAASLQQVDASERPGLEQLIALADANGPAR